MASQGSTNHCSSEAAWRCRICSLQPLILLQQKLHGGMAVGRLTGAGGASAQAQAGCPNPCQTMSKHPLLHDALQQTLMAASGRVQAPMCWW